MKSGWWLLVGGLSTLLGACGDSSPAQTVEGSGPERVGEQRAALSTYTEDFESARLNGPWPLQWSTQSTNASVALTTTAAFSGGQLARVNGPTGGSTTHYLLGAAPRVDSEQTVNVAIGQSSVHLGLVARRSAPDSYYGCWVGQSLSTERLRVYKVVPGSGPQDLFTVGTSPTAGVATIATSNAWYRLRFKVTQDNTTNPPSTRLQARLWQGPSEPSGWTLDYVDSEPLLQNSAGYNGIKGDDGSAAANRFMYFDDYQLDSVASANVCTSDANCESGRFCSQAGECRMYSDSCSTNVQCGPAQVCQYSACICPPGASGCQVNGGPGPTLVDLKASVPSLQYRPVTFARDTTDYFVLPTQSPVTTAPTSPQLQRANHFIMNVAATQPVTLSVGASGTSAAPHALADLVAYDSSGTFIKRAIIDSALPGPFQNSIDLGSLAAGNYEFDIVPRTAGLKYTVTAPNSSITLAFKGGADLTEAGMNTYFFVPAEVEKALLIGQFDASGVPQFFGPDNNPVTPIPASPSTTTYIIDTKGKPGVWRTSFRTTSSRAHFVNLPDLFSFDPNAVIASKRIRTEMTPGSGATTAITSPNNRYNNRFSFHVASASTPVFTIGNGSSITSPPHIVVRIIDSSGADMPGSPFDINPNGTPQPASSPLQPGDYELHVTNPSIYNAYSIGVPPGIPFVSVDGYGVAYYYANARSYFTIPAGTPSVRFAAKANSVPIEIYNASGTFVGAPTLLGNNVYEISLDAATIQNGGIWAINLKNDYWSDIRLLNVPQIIAFNKDQLETVGPSGPIVCSSDADCPTGKVCGQDNGAHFGLAATTDVWYPFGQPRPDAEYADGLQRLSDEQLSERRPAERDGGGSLRAAA